MTLEPPETDPGFLSASLAASRVGTWEYDTSENRIRYCRTFAQLYGMPPEQGRDGMSFDDITARIHPDDRTRRLAKWTHMRRHGGLVILEYRVLPSPTMMRWIMLRGFYAPDPVTGIIHGRGIAIDVTESKREGFAEGDVFFYSDCDDRTTSALDLATKHVLAARRALADVASEKSARLRAAADALLIEIAHQVAGTMVPVAPRRMEH